MRTINICGKCSDCCSATLEEDGKILGSHDGSVPRFLDRSGDYMEFKIDIDTGQIVGWKKPTEEELAEVFDLEKDNER